MWPFKKKEKVSMENLLYSQVDITEKFGDNVDLTADEWIKTIPINSMGPATNGLPSSDATPEKVYKIAKDMSAIRETINLPQDGVYCPICHIANTRLNKLHTPCPKCGRELLKFGWD